MNEDRLAKRDFVTLWLALARRALGQDVAVPELDGQLALDDPQPDERTQHDRRERPNGTA